MKKLLFIFIVCTVSLFSLFGSDNYAEPFNPSLNTNTKAFGVSCTFLQEKTELELSFLTNQNFGYRNSLGILFIADTGIRGKKTDSFKNFNFCYNLSIALSYMSKIKQIGSFSYTNNRFYILSALGVHVTNSLTSANLSNIVLGATAFLELDISVSADNFVGLTLQFTQNFSPSESAFKIGFLYGIQRNR